MRLAGHVRGPNGSTSPNPGNAWVNRHYSAFVYEWPDGGAVLSIKPKDGARHDWREFQRMKNEIFGPHREAVELYPSEDRLVDTANQFYLFVAPEGIRWPFGFLHREVSENLMHDTNTQRPWPAGEKPEDLYTPEQQRERGPIAPFMRPPWWAFEQHWREMQESMNAEQPAEPAQEAK